MTRQRSRGSRRPERRSTHARPKQISRTAGARFARLVEIMQQLRGPTGCPWDREQTLDSLKPFVLEETYETLDAIDRDDVRALREEIGDLLFEAVFLAQVCAEAEQFTIADSVGAVADKLVRRHPHVFAVGPGRPRVATAGAVLEQWEQLKAREQKGRADAERGVLAGIPRTLPALLRAYEIGARAATVGFDWAKTRDVVAKIEEEAAELRRAVEREPPSRVAEEMGDLLFAVANLSRKLGVEPEGALRAANDKFSRRFNDLEAGLAARNRSVHDATLDELEHEWQKTKSEQEERTATMRERLQEIKRRRHVKEKRQKLRSKLTTASEQERAHIEAKLLKTYSSWTSPADVLPKRAGKK